MFHITRFPHIPPTSPLDCSINTQSHFPLPDTSLHLKNKKNQTTSSTTHLNFPISKSMEAASSLCCSHALPPRPFPGNPRRRQKKLPGVILASKRDAHDRDYGGRIVDESMIVLRKRIHEIEMIEGKNEAPTDWMDWEKRYYNTNYYSDICEAMAVFQSQLMNTRPSLALGMVALIAFSLPTSVGFVLFHLAEIAKGTITGVHL